MRASDSLHARAVVQRDYYPLAFETDEHLSTEERDRFEELLPQLEERFGAPNFLVSHSAKDPHRLGESRVLVQRFDGQLEPMEKASHFIRHLARIERYRIYTPRHLKSDVAEILARLWS